MKRALGPGAVLLRGFAADAAPLLADLHDVAAQAPFRHVVVWGGPARMRYHGVLPLKAGHHRLLGGQRV